MMEPPPPGIEPDSHTHEVRVVATRPAGGSYYVNTGFIFSLYLHLFRFINNNSLLHSI